MLPFALGGRGHVDLVLVVVIYAALQFGPATGLLTGAVAGVLAAMAGPAPHGEDVTA
jgi:thiamine transporter ThiT